MITQKMDRAMTSNMITLTETECTALVDAAYAEYKAVIAGPHTSDDRQDAWDTAIEKRDAAYARLNAKSRTLYGI